ncbi:MAG: tRNA (guanosine(46)-N7)-methyltransferase TrmB [Clostridia bacterium]|nr:tRNA (guanosine(46)-N7)-methyltransferase TrmB [Clostridia bacterium]
MRMRKKKHGSERIAACSHLLIEDPTVLLENPQSPFPVARPLCLEIGCGKGGFAVGTAAAEPEFNLIAVERISDVMVNALEGAAAAADTRPDNLRFLIGDAQHLGEWLPPHCLSRIYLNFSDPWPKKGYAKRRLTYRTFLAIYADLLAPGGEIRFKTDNVGLFDFTLEEAEACGWTLSRLTRDLHHSEWAEGNIMTEYERHFSEQGVTINAVTLTPPEQKEY